MGTDQQVIFLTGNEEETLRHITHHRASNDREFVSIQPIRSLVQVQQRLHSSGERECSIVMFRFRRYKSRCKYLRTVARRPIVGEWRAGECREDRQQSVNIFCLLEYFQVVQSLYNLLCCQRFPSRHFHRSPRRCCCFQRRHGSRIRLLRWVRRWME